ncbi:retrovirus-related pol polyprotein from transposon TNT 1-94, partial [Tanacetum coccineum]
MLTTKEAPLLSKLQRMVPSDRTLLVDLWKMNKDGLAMTQRKYATELVKHAGLLDTKPLATPLDTIAKLSMDTDDLLPDPSYYRTLV